MTNEKRRRCARCRDLLPVESFGTRRQGGRVYPVSYCRPCKTAHERERYARPEVKAAYRMKDERMRVQFAERIRARRIVQTEIRAGRLVRGECCSAGPGCRGKIEAHHDDYTRPLDVVWTCKAHHQALDRARRAVEVPRKLPRLTTAAGR